MKRRAWKDVYCENCHVIKEILHQIRSTDRIKHLTVDFLVTDSTFDIFLYLDSEFYCKDMNNL